MDKLDKLQKILERLENVVVAFSGGVDSSFLLKTARDILLQKNVLAVTAISDTYTRSELIQAKNFTKSIDVEHKIIITEEFKDPNFTKNPPDRCYYCKKELFKKLSGIADKRGRAFVLDGSNLDDEKDYRPGSRARMEFGVRSPLQEAGITKDDVRRFSKRLGLKTWSLPSMACLASRVPYGERIRKSTLRKIEKAEKFIKALGVGQVRVRCHREIARIEVDKKDIKRFFEEKFCDTIIKYLKSLGFCYVVLDLEGYKTGSLNELRTTKGGRNTAA